MTDQPTTEASELDVYDAGLLGGDHTWTTGQWQDYLRGELERANEHYQNQHAAEVAELREKMAERNSQLARWHERLGEWQTTANALRSRIAELEAERDAAVKWAKACWHLIEKGMKVRMLESWPAMEHAYDEAKHARAEWEQTQ